MDDLLAPQKGPMESTKGMLMGYLMALEIKLWKVNKLVISTDGVMVLYWVI